MLVGVKWQKISWRNGTKGRLQARFAAFACAPPMDHRADKGASVCLAMKCGSSANRTSGEKKYYLAICPQTFRARCSCRQGAMDL